MPVQRRQTRYQVGDYWLTKNKRYKYWRAAWYEGAANARQTRSASLGTPDFEEAKQALKAFVVERERPKNSPAEALETVTCMSIYWEDHAKHIASAGQIQASIGHLTETFAGLPISDLTPNRIRGFVQKRRDQGCSDATIRRNLSDLNAALNHARKQNYVMAVPFIQLPPRPPARDRILTMEEMAALFACCETPHVFTFLMVAANTLARPENILDLRSFQIHVGDRLIKLNPPGRAQTKKHRPIVPITNTLLPYVTDLKSEYVVSYKGKEVKSIKTAFRKLRVRAGLSEDVVAKTIRYTMAVELRKRAVPALEIAGMLGHKTLGESETYAAYAADYLGEAARAIDDYFDELWGRKDMSNVVRLRG